MSDVILPPFARRLDVTATRAAFAAGTLGAVRDDAPHGDAERHAVVTQPDRFYRDDVEHARQSRLTRWQADR